MKVKKADHLGMCFGVRDAIALATRHAAAGPLTVVGELVHNETVLSDLREKGIQIATGDQSISTKSVMITAHGASALARERLQKQELVVWEATCPLVQFAHRSLFRLVQKGYHPIIVGQKNHVEVRGLTEDLKDFDVVLGEADVLALKARKLFGVIAQTTQPIERVQFLVDSIQRRFPSAEVFFVDTVCQPTKQRQAAAIKLAKECDAVVVVGGANSNNTRELVKTSERFCRRVFHVQNASELRSEWFIAVENVGITAGTSTPDSVIKQVELRLKQLQGCV